jgi:hypothetical protein
MSFELVNRISVKKDGVYISTHSNNDSAPFHSVKLKHISDIMEWNGGVQFRKIKALKEFVKMFSYYGNCRLAEYRQNEHESIKELRAAFDACYSQTNKEQRGIQEKINNFISESKFYSQAEKDIICDKFDEIVNIIAVERTAEYYLKNGGGKRWGILEV